MRAAYRLLTRWWTAFALAASLAMLGAAHAFERFGGLAPGKWADFIILDTDLMKASPEEILHAKILETRIAGEKLF